MTIAPFQCLISVLNATDEALLKAAEEVYTQLQAEGVDVLIDDRNERPGVKFKDADLIGIPYRVNFGSKKFAAGKVEWVERVSKKSEDIEVGQLVSKASTLLRPHVQAA